MTSTSNNEQPVIYWFRQDLRLHDLRGLNKAVATGRPVLACYILDDQSPGQWQMGGASRWWLHHSLAALSADIEKAGGQLYLARGKSEVVLARLTEQSGATLVCCSRQYEPWARQLEKELHESLEERNVELKRYGGSLLWEPETVSTLAGTPFKVFTPFWNKCRDLPLLLEPDTRIRLSRWPASVDAPDTLNDLSLRPTNPDWAKSWGDLWQPGERHASAKLSAFLRGPVSDYDAGRNYPARGATSRLSAHLHFGEIAPARVFHTAREAALGDPELQAETDKFLSELGWREFSHHLLFHFPQMPEEPFKADFAAFPWLGGARELRAWQKGLTGYPIVDAGMRELWQTGYMHNRVRMVVASFLCKHLLVNWRAGQRWFWDTLVDADLANNACGWQWVAGSGADASPYFRIFNPTAQGEKFDKGGDYVRRWVPELAALPDRYLHQPWAAPEKVLQEAGMELPADYPLPIVDHREARESALAAYADIRTQQGITA
ncbi:MAG: deoxyribodipyrimidine photo-lyase [Halioglobus sp.]|nr:deoxyribodipyrimidine photo-lyase [Halioglobus sp.]